MHSRVSFIWQPLTKCSPNCRNIFMHSHNYIWRLHNHSSWALHISPIQHAASNSSFRARIQTHKYIFWFLLVMLFAVCCVCRQAYRRTQNAYLIWNTPGRECFSSKRFWMQRESLITFHANGEQQMNASNSHPVLFPEGFEHGCAHEVLLLCQRSTWLKMQLAFAVKWNHNIVFLNG